ncbi:MAG: glycosyltransferase family A protein [Pedobacter sp.]|nr:glycosyltransferase family A protein [Pedobacter sp.]MDQ8053951.1 glycosyltransferase family A protein [Pedobacter sp.]
MDEDLQLLIKEPLVSIIIPLYNAEKFIADTIQSALSQTWKNIEIIVVDDDSTDGSLAIAKKFEAKGVQVLHQKNSGASAARNKGLSISKGKYIQFLDADDFITENKIEEQLIVLKDLPNHLGLCATVYFFDGEDPFQQKPIHEWYGIDTDDTADFIIKLYGGPIVGQTFGGMIQPNAWLTPRTIIDRAGGWDESLSLDDDGEFFCRIMLAADGIRYTTAPVNYYRKFRKGSNLSAKKDRKAAESMVKVIDLKHRYLLEAIPQERPLIDQIMARHYLSAAANLYPSHKDIVNRCLQVAKSLGYTKIDYEGGTPGKLFSKIFGWKLTKDFGYISRWIKGKINTL